METSKKHRLVVDLTEREMKRYNEIMIAMYERGMISSLVKTKVVKEYILKDFYNTMKKKDAVQSTKHNV